MNSWLAELCICMVVQQSVSSKCWGPVITNGGQMRRHSSPPLIYTVITANINLDDNPHANFPCIIQLWDKTPKGNIRVTSHKLHLKDKMFRYRYFRNRSGYFRKRTLFTDRGYCARWRFPGTSKLAEEVTIKQRKKRTIKFPVRQSTSTCTTAAPYV